MEIKEFWRKIKLAPAAIDALMELEVDEDEYQHLKSLFVKEKTEFYQQILKRKQYRLKFLYCYSRMAIDIYPLYQQRFISEKVFIDTFYDLTLWSNNCFKRFSEYGIEQYHWFASHLELKLFRLGRLEFERIDANDYLIRKDIGIKKGDTLIDIHIPEGEKLTPLSVQESLVSAFDFWDKDYKYICHSWLLYPNLKEILAKDSNILQFQELFDIVKIDYDYKEAEIRLYGRVEEDISNYAEHTSLQKSAKEYLLSGKRLGRAIGILKK